MAGAASRSQLRNWQQRDHRQQLFARRSRSCGRRGIPRPAAVSFISICALGDWHSPRAPLVSAKDIPPFLIAAEINYVFGVNVIGLRRAGFSGQDRDEIKAAFKLLYTSGLNISQALKKAAAMNLAHPLGNFSHLSQQQKKRGILPAQTRCQRRAVDLTRVSRPLRRLSLTNLIEGGYRALVEPIG